jgi:hypothetical protein
MTLDFRFSTCLDVKGKASALAEADELLLRTFARRCGVYLALVALTLQFALSFGHIHHHDIASPNLAHSGLAYSRLAYASLVHSKIGVLAGSQALTKLRSSKQLPAPLADDDENCPICFSTMLLTSSFVPDAPQYSPSFDFKDVDRFSGHTFDLIFGSDRAPFQSRAPPLS